MQAVDLKNKKREATLGHVSNAVSPTKESSGKGDFAVERKELGDLDASLRGGRFDDQLQRLEGSFFSNFTCLVVGEVSSEVSNLQATSAATGRYAAAPTSTHETETTATAVSRHCFDGWQFVLVDL